MISRGLIVTLCDQQEPHPRTFLLCYPQVKKSIQAAVKFALLIYAIKGTNHFNNCLRLPVVSCSIQH